MPGKDERRAEPRGLLRDALDLAAMGIAASLIGLVATGAPGLPRIFLALAFAFFVPGRAVVSNSPRLAYWSDFGLPIVISLAVLTLAAATALWAHLWHPVGLFEIEAGLSVVALGAGLTRRHRRAAEEPGEPDETRLQTALSHAGDDIEPARTAGDATQALLRFPIARQDSHGAADQASNGELQE